MSKTFFDMILFLTKFDTDIVYTYGYYNCKVDMRGAEM